MSLYKRFVQVLEKWPVDKTKPGRDFGEHIREQAKILFAANKALTTEDPKLEKQIVALENIVNNKHQNQFPRTLKSTATGLTAEQCNQVLSSEFLEYINEDQRK